MHGLVVARGQAVGRIDSSVGRDIQEEKLANARHQNFQRGAGTVRRRRFGHESADQCVDLAEAAQRFPGDGAREAGVARLQPALGDDIGFHGVQRAAPAQHFAQDFHRRGARGNPGGAHALAFRMARS